MKRLILLFVSVLIFQLNLNAQTFTDLSNTGLPAIEYSHACWGDYDNDGDKDVIIAGEDNSGPVVKLYKNTTTGFTEVTGLSITALYKPRVDWGDYNNDGYLDILITGSTNSWNGSQSAKIYKNNGNQTFTVQTSYIGGVYNGDSQWFDFDNDGDLDILIAGQISSSNNRTRIYENTGTGFTYLSTSGLTDLESTTVNIYDFDKDGYKDILISQWNKLFKNNGDKTFSMLHDSIPHLYWGDYFYCGDWDNDGDIDIIGQTNTTAWLYTNDGNFKFTKINTHGLSSALHHKSWVDYDNDGDLDVLSKSNQYTYLHFYNNTNGTFAEAGDSLAGFYNHSVHWADYDNDNDLDVLVTGYTYPVANGPATKLFQNNASSVNSAPQAPTGLSAQKSGSSVLFKWNKGSDTTTPSQCLSYNICVGTHPDTCNIVIPNSDLTTGFNKLAKWGSITDTFYYVKIPTQFLNASKIYWRVQSVDYGMLGSSFSLLDSMTLGLSITASNDITMHRYDTCTISIAHNTASNITYSWTPTLGLSNPNGQSTEAYPLQTTKYYISVSDGTNTNIDSVTVTVLQNPFVKIRDKNGVMMSSLDWGNYNVDDDLELLVGGSSDHPNGIGAVMYGSYLTQQTSINLSSWSNGSGKWTDYDNDGDMDILISGASYSSFSNPVTKIYRNFGWYSFYEQSLNMQAFRRASMDMADFDRDGDIDVLISGEINSNTENTILYRNDRQNGFTEITGSQLPQKMGEVSWGDYDRDGLVDILFASSDSTVIYRNNGDSTFTMVPQVLLTGVNAGAAKWADYDNDGDLDIFIIGTANSVTFANIYRNNGNHTFPEQTHINIQGLSYSDAAWGDLDQDGFMDLVISGKDGTTRLSQVYKNTGMNDFILDTNIVLVGYEAGSIALGDYDFDGDLDMAMTGYADDNDRHIALYKNNNPIINLRPSTPSNITFNPISKVLSWNSALDDHTPSQALTYNVSIGTAHNKVGVMAGHVDMQTGLRQVARIGNQESDTFCVINYNFHLDSTYIFNVQAIDHCYRGSDTINYVYTIPFAGYIINADTTLQCGDSVILKTHSLTGNTGLSYVWSPAMGLSGAFDQPTASPTSTTTYYVTVSNSSGLSFTDSVVVKIQIPGLDFNANKTQLLTAPYDVQFTNLCPNLADYDFTWYFGDGNSVTDNNSTVNYTYTSVDSYDVYYTAKHKQQGCEDSILKVTYIQCGPTAIEDVDAQKMIMKVSPNPNNGEFTIHLQSIISGQYTLNIWSSVGALHHSESLRVRDREYTHNLNLNHLAKGVYFIQIQSEETHIIQKLIIQ